VKTAAGSSREVGGAMSRRVRAIAFLGLALLAAGLAAAIADGYGSRIAGGFGPLRPVVVLSDALPAGKPIGPGELTGALERRRVPARFVPAGALTTPAAALGLVPTATLPPGSYLLVAQLRSPQRRDRTPDGLRGGRAPVEISVSGADALFAGGAARPGRRVDVVVTSEPNGSRSGRTYVAAARVPLLALGPGADGSAPGGVSAATLGLTRRQALRLIAAESFARKVTLLPWG
jgi:Flp pilus assembly protein CpaB